MLASEILVTDIPVLSKTDSIAQAIEWMDEFKVTHLAVIEGSKLLGLVHEDLLMEIADPTNEIGKYEQHYINASVYENEHLFQVVKRVEEFNLSLIPVLSSQDKFVGVTTVINVMEMIADMPVVKAPGGILVLNVQRMDYSMTEISRVVENSEAKIMGAFVTRQIDDYLIEVTLKIDKSNVSGIQSSLEQLGYEVSAAYEPADQGDDVLDNYNNLMNYLNI